MGALGRSRAGLLGAARHSPALPPNLSPNHPKPPAHCTKQNTCFVSCTNPNNKPNSKLNSKPQTTVYASDAFLELTEYPREEVLGRNCRFLQVS